MANSHVLISSQTLGSPAATIIFGSGGTLSQSYRDLIIVLNGNGTSGSGTMGVRLNGDTSTSNYVDVGIYGDGSTAGSENHTTLGYIKSSITTFANQEQIRIDIFDYSATDKHKTVLIRETNGNAGVGIEYFAGRWASTSAVTSVTLMHGGTNTFATGTTAYLYGVTA
jgi:hypothetical protein